MAEDSMEAETRNLQNDFFNAARRDKVNVTVFLANGKKLTGRIKSFDKFTLLLESHHGDQIIFKHAISTVSTTPRSAGPANSASNHEASRKGAEPVGSRPPRE